METFAPVTGPLSASPSLCMCASVRRAARVITQIYDAALAPSGIGISQFSLLATIRLQEDASRTELAASLAMDRTTLARNLQLLERGGFIESLEGDDRRIHHVRLTEGGRAAFRRALPLWREAQQRVWETLGETRWNDARARLSDIEALMTA